MGFKRASSDPDRRYQLTPRQREIVVLIVKGHTNAEIAAELRLSLDGVKWHVREILGRLDVDSREQAAAVWQQDQRPAARFGRLARGFAGVPLVLKGAALSGLAAVVVAGGAFMVAAARSQDDTPAPPDAATATNEPTIPVPDDAATNGIADLSVEEATVRALAAVDETLAANVLLGHAQGAVPFAGRTLQASDLILQSRTFDPRDADLRLEDRWTMTFATDGLRANPDDGEPKHLAVTVVIADGSDARLGAEVAEGSSDMRFDTVAHLRAIARGEEPGDPEPMPADQTSLLPVTVLDLGMRRVTVTIYGDPADPCLRLDDTGRADGGRGHSCPMVNLATKGMLLNLTLGSGYINGAVGDDVREAFHGERDGATILWAPITLVRPPAPYDQVPRVFLHAGSGGSLRLDGRGDVEVYTLEKATEPTGGLPLHSIGNFHMDETGPATTPSFDVPNRGAVYPFIFQFPEDGGPVRLTAECDAGSVVLIDQAEDERLSPQAGSMLVSFPAGSTSCAFRVEAEPGVRWQLMPK